MKKVIVFLLTIVFVAVVVILFTSCGEQPGVYKPKKKISKVYGQVDEEEEYLAQAWIWGGDKVYSISYFYEGVFRLKEEFIYEGDRVSQIRDSRGYYSDYVYVDDQFERIKYYDPTDVLLAETTFRYYENKISVVLLNVYEDDKNVISMIERGFLGKLLSEEGVKIVAEKIANQSKKTMAFNIYYEGENVSKLTIMGGPNMAEDNIILEEYDTHSNIWYNFFPCSTFEHREFNIRGFSKNNPGKEFYQNDNVFSVCTYAYDGDFPVTIQRHFFQQGISSISTIRIEYQ